MRTILNFVLDHQDGLYMSMIVALFAIIGTYLIYWITNKNKFMKYLPGLLMFFIALYKLYIGWLNITKPEGIDDISLAVTIGVGGVVSLCFAWILGIKRKYKRKPKAKTKTKVKRRKGVL